MNHHKRKKYKKPKEAVAKDEKQEETDALAAQRRAIQNESATNQLSNPARSHQTQNSEKESQASKIASAARTKQAKLKENKDVASNTRKLFEEAPITSSKYDKVPNLITKNHKSFNKDEEITKINKLTMMLNLKKELLLTNINHLNQIQIKNKNIIKT